MGILVALAVGLAACSGGSKAAIPTNSLSVTTRPAVTTTVPPGRTTTTTRPEYSFDDSVPPPKVLDTGRKYVAILRSLGEYGNWLSAHRPDSALAQKILAPGSKILRLFSRDLDRLRANNKRLIERVRSSPTYDVISTTTDAVSMRMRESILLQETFDAAGRVTSLAPFPEHSNYRVLMVLVHGHWRIAADDAELPPVNVEQ